MDNNNLTTHALTIQIMDTYDQIAEDFDPTRTRPWPESIEFIKTLDKGTTVLDLGSGNGRNSQYLAEQGFRVISLDFSINMLKIAAEKIIVGSTSSPRSWYSKHVAQMSKSDWHAAQDRMWSSETAFKEFKQTHLRAGISRGGFINALFTMLSLLFVYLSGSWEKDLWPVFLIALFLLLVSPISWWFAHVEHTARVRIAGEILKEKSL